MENSSNQSVIITLDVDSHLYDKLQKISKSGFSVVEINSTDTSILSGALGDFPHLRIGAGNITDTQQLENCYQAGANFITSPGFLPAIAQTANIYSINYIPGIATPSEAMQAMALGCHHVRPYPATLELCTLLNKSLPLLRLFPADIEWEETELYFNLPSVAGVSVLNPDVDKLPQMIAA